MLSLFLFALCLVLPMSTVHFQNIPMDSLHLVYRYLENIDRHKAFESINRKMASIHRSETLQTKTLMKEMDSFFRPNCIKERIKDILAIHDKLWLNEQYHLMLPMRLRIWRRRMQRPSAKKIFDEIASLIAPSTKVSFLVLGATELNELISSSQRIANCMEWDSGPVNWSFECLLYPHLWNIAAQANTLLPSLESVYYLKENEEANSGKIRYLKHLTEECHLRVIHPRFRNPKIESIPMQQQCLFVDGAPRGDRWHIELSAKWLITWMENDSADSTFHKMVKWTNPSEREALHSFWKHSFEKLLLGLFSRNEDASSRLVLFQEILIGLQRHHAVFCINTDGFLSLIIQRSRSRYPDFVGMMIHTLSNEIDLDTATKVARSIGSWRLQEIEWGIRGIKPDLTMSMDILCALAEDEKYDDRLLDELMRLLAPESDLLWNLVVDTDGYLRWALAILKGGQREIGKGDLKLHWYPRSRFKLKGE